MFTFALEYSSDDGMIRRPKKFMNKIIKTSLPKQVADNIEQLIKNGTYKIGDKLPTEPELVSQYGIGRNTLREAIQSLTNSGLLESRQGDGTYVIAKERLQVEFFNAMEASDNKNVLEVRNMLENHIVVSAIDNATEEDIQTIEQLLHLRKQVSESVRENTQADLNFHIAITNATHNDLLISIYKYVSSYFNEFIYSKIYSKSQDQQYIDELHDLLFSAIKSKDKTLAQNYVKKIIEI